MKLGSKLILGFSSVLIIFIISVVVGFWGLSSSENVALQLEERYKQLRLMDDLKQMGTELILTQMDIIVDKDKKV